MFQLLLLNTNVADVPSPWNLYGLSGGWKGYSFWHDNVELPKVLNSMTMIDLINCVRADIFPVQTEQTRNTYYIAFQILKKLQAI